MRHAGRFALSTVCAVFWAGFAIAAVEASPTPPPQGGSPQGQVSPATPPGQQAQPPDTGRGQRGRGTGGLPPMNPIDENAPLPPLVTPAASLGDPPSDAVVLFDGRDLSQWKLRDGSPARCKVENREMVCRTGDQNLVSVPTFASAQIHLEYAVPDMPAVDRNGRPNGQYKGNSGVFLHGSYEIQVLDSYKNLNRTYADGTNASLYRVAAPLVNVSRAPGEWQSFDIVIHAPKCDNGTLASPGDITLFHNGVLVLDRVAPRLRNPQCQPGMTEMSGPLMLQDHEQGGPMTVMKFRNIWFRPLPAGK
jgi:hypothetical protein